MAKRKLIGKIMSGHTCGIVCWAAQDDVCHCSCGGVNHGILRKQPGHPVVRTRKKDDKFYELTSVLHGHKELMILLQEDPKFYANGCWTQVATKAEVSTWPELTRFRTQSPVDRVLHSPLLIWTPTNKYA